MSWTLTNPAQVERMLLRLNMTLRDLLEILDEIPVKARHSEKLLAAWVVAYNTLPEITHSSVCTWKLADNRGESDLWETGCGHRHELPYGSDTPTAMGFAYCCFCGRPIREEFENPIAEKLFQ